MDAIRVRSWVSIVLGAVALGLGALGLAMRYGLAAEYSGGAGLQILPLVVGIPVLTAAAAIAVWPGSSARATLVGPLGLVVVLVVSSVLADRLGDREHEQRLLAESASLGCNGPNAEIMVDDRVDQVFAELPRPAPLYGPISGTRDGCVAGVAGDALTGFMGYSTALRALVGWSVVTDEPSLLVLRRGDGLTIRLSARTEGVTLGVTLPSAALSG